MPGVLDSYDLTPIQSGMLVHALRSPGRGVDIQQIVAHQTKAYQRDAFAAAWAAVMARHPVLRTAIAWADHEKPRQLVHAPAGVTLPITEDDWSTLAPGEQDERLADYLRTDRARDFDLACPPLMRLHLVRLSPATSLFVWTFHHALLDGRAFHLVLEELYAALDGDGVDARCPTPAFRNYIDWLAKLDPEPARAYFKRRLEGFSQPTRLWLDGYDFADQPRPGEPLGAGRPAPFGAAEGHLDQATTAALVARARDDGVSLNTLVLGAWALLLHRLSGENYIVFGATRTCRHAF